MFNISFLELIKSFWEIIRLLWPLWSVLLGVILIKIFWVWFEGWIDRRRTEKWLEKHKTLEEWKKVDGRKFEKITGYKSFKNKFT